MHIIIISIFIIIINYIDSCMHVQIQYHVQYMNVGYMYIIRITYVYCAVRTPLRLWNARFFKATWNNSRQFFAIKQTRIQE